MCQSLVSKLAQSRQLKAVTVPEILVLFEDWMEELELEALERLAAKPDHTPLTLADDLGLSVAGAQFILEKLKNEAKA
ncbi:MAG: hypothetical protein KQJ78_23330 [Deltaproteobacteria bacterium]|nr:hypothetical protein [Deltaproteobacteria bacterium]